MSIVIGAVTGNHAWIMSDGRQCSAADKSVIREDLPKFQMINEGLYIGYTKGYESAMEAMQDFKAICPNIKNVTVDDALGILQAIMTSKRIGKPRLNAQFIAVGRAAAGGDPSRWLRCFVVKPEIVRYWVWFVEHYSENRDGASHGNR